MLESLHSVRFVLWGGVVEYNVEYKIGVLAGLFLNLSVAESTTAIRATAPSLILRLSQTIVALCIWRLRCVSRAVSGIRWGVRVCPFQLRMLLSPSPPILLAGPALRRS